MTIAEHLRQEGRLEGRQEGLYQTAKRLLQRGDAVEDISVITGLSIAEIKALQDKE